MTSRPTLLVSIFACLIQMAQGDTLSCDVVVVGGGSAGFAAAWNASRRGSSVILVERADRLGGTTVVGGVSNWEPDCGGDGTPREVYERLRRKPLASGVYMIERHCLWDDPRKGVFPGCLTVVDPKADYSMTLRRHGPGMSDEKWFRANCRGVIFEPEALDETMREMPDETGRCRVLLKTAFVSARKDAAGFVHELSLSNGDVIHPKIVIDACGAVCRAIGCKVLKSPRPNGATLVYRVAHGKEGRCTEDSHGGDGFGGELKQPYGIPYRCLLPKGTVNVLIAGRCASFDAVAASSCRLSRTMMRLGEAVGMAAHTSVVRRIPLREIKMPSREPLRRFVLADESRAKVHLWDSDDPSATFEIPVERPVWNFKKVRDGVYRIVCKRGFMVVDLFARRVVKTFRHFFVRGGRT